MNRRGAQRRRLCALRARLCVLCVKDSWFDTQAVPGGWIGNNRRAERTAFHDQAVAGLAAANKGIWARLIARIRRIDRQPLLTAGAARSLLQAERLRQPEGDVAMATDSNPSESAARTAAQFAATHWSVVLAAGDGASPESSAALEWLCRTYCYPLYAFVRRKGYSVEDAEDLVQDFLIGLTTPSPSAPIRFGDYELLEEIGHGGMGLVYKARHLSLNRVVALKLLLPGPFSSPEMLSRFRREAQAAAALSHPGIVHRDLKPANLLIDLDDRVRVADFGLAKRLDEVTDLTLSGQVLGSPDYLAPEQALGKHAPPRPASDIYSAGAIPQRRTDPGGSFQP